jgi:ADP-ribosylglycohydrolase
MYFSIEYNCSKKLYSGMEVLKWCTCFVAQGACDRIAGVVFGHALGDAIGLTTEFIDKLPAAIVFPYTDSIRNVEPNDWTDDTDLMLTLMFSLANNNMTFTPNDVAGRYRYWVEKGLPELGDTAPTTPNNMFKFIVSQPEYIKDPVTIATRALASANGNIINNSPLTRMAVLGVLHKPEAHTNPKLKQLAVDFCMLTHIDPRCIASCVFFAHIINSLCYNNIASVDELDASVGVASESALTILPDDQKSQFQEIIARPKSLINLNLGDLKHASHIYTTLSVIMYAVNVVKVSLQHKKRPSWRKTICSIVMQGGDADANAAVAGAILGAYLGFKQLPHEFLIAMPHISPLDQFTASFISKLMNPTTIDENAAAAGESLEPL